MSASSKKTPYEILGVEPTAKPRAVRKAFLDHVKRLHPDANGGVTTPAMDAELRAVIDAHDAIKQQQGDPDARIFKKTREEYSTSSARKTQPMTADELKWAWAQYQAAMTLEGGKTLAARDKKLSQVRGLRSGGAMLGGVAGVTAIALSGLSFVFGTAAAAPVLFGVGIVVGYSSLAGAIGAVVASNVVEGQRMRLHQKFQSMARGFYQKVPSPAVTSRAGREPQRPKPAAALLPPA